MTATATQPTSEQRDAVLKHHKSGRPAGMIATITTLPVKVVEEIIAAAATPPSSSRPGRALDGLVELPIDHVHPSPNNPREKLTEIGDLATSITQVGLIQPLVVQPLDSGGFQIVAGHRRYAAVTTLGWLNVPCLVRKPLRSDEELLTMLIENGQRANLDPIEEARAYQRLKTTGGMMDLEIARQVGRSQSYVSGRIALLSLSVEEQEQIRAGLAGVTVMSKKARMDSGKVRPNAWGKSGPGHLSLNHPLSARVKARCIAAGHSRGRGVGVGGIGCGECWETVIRANEREKIHAASAVAGRCLICGAQHDADRSAS